MKQQAKNGIPSRITCQACGRAVPARPAPDGSLQPVRHKDRRTGLRCKPSREPIPSPAPSRTTLRVPEWPRVECRVCGRAVQSKLDVDVLRPLRHKDRRTGLRCEAKPDPVAPPVAPGSAMPTVQPSPANDDGDGAALPVEGDVKTAIARLPPEARRPFVGREESARLHAIAAHAGRRTYRAQWELFRLWCEAIGARPLPAHPDLLRIYARHLEATGRRGSSIAVPLYAIVAAHEACELDAEPLIEVRRALCRVLTPSPSPSISCDELKTILATCDSGAMGVRDRAMLLAAYHGRLLSCRVVALNVGDLRRDPDSYLVQVHATGKPVRLNRIEEPDLCPVRALDRWLAMLADVRQPDVAPVGDPEQEPLFMALHPQRGRDAMLGTRLGAGEVARVLKRHVAAAGLDERRYKTTALRAVKNAGGRSRRPVRAA
jgi:hypothetical protein